jgi:hypothetical protein
MTKYQCTSCGGEYFNSDREGRPYFHACPPIQMEDGTTKERDDKRDENAGAKLEGKGRSILK